MSDPYGWWPLTKCLEGQELVTPLRRSQSIIRQPTVTFSRFRDIAHFDVTVVGSPELRLTSHICFKEPLLGLQ